MHHAKWWESKKSTLASKNFEHDQSTNKHHQSSHNEFAKWPLKGICDPLKKISNLSQPISPSKSIFSPLEPSSELITYRMEHTWVKCTHPSNTQICTLQLSSNITKVMHLSSCALTLFSFHDTSKWSQFSSDHAPCKSYSCCYAMSKFHKPGIYPEQIACFIYHKSCKYHTKITFETF